MAVSVTGTTGSTAVSSAVLFLQEIKARLAISMIAVLFIGLFVNIPIVKFIDDLQFADIILRQRIIDGNQIADGNCIFCNLRITRNEQLSVGFYQRFRDLNL